ncbi:sulfite exporter TauE/SafE family protein [Heliorestis acidaminivorans]|uniref:Probable membrane transporter protein n=1 Tax=Heliorestis acidaminivorans TaxID=553427 RepID=A0A6I0F3J3_9FIRM|nr:sulfite exporter TauE/SafE family protein [Heliorestis acidaminivorans]KAB2953297.1 sulfite exporter TauE/SafE family protein [Heliorestis acidaminivorans]
MDYLLLILIGLFAGGLGSLVGVGGGFVVIPFLLLFFDYPPAWAVATSLAFIFVNSLSSSIVYSQQKRIDFKTGIPFAISTIPGAIAGAFIIPYFAERTFDTAFGLLLIAVSIFMLMRPEGPVKDRTPSWLGPKVTRQFVDAHGVEYNYSFSIKFGMLLSFGVGFISSLFGIGGGIIHVPAMTLLLGIPPHIATATSMFILTISTVVASFAHFTQGNVQLMTALFLALGAIAGGQVGARLAPKIKGPLLMRIFAGLMFILALQLLTK